jgi:hypothetical protein
MYASYPASCKCWPAAYLRTRVFSMHVGGSLLCFACSKSSTVDSRIRHSFENRHRASLGCDLKLILSCDEENFEYTLVMLMNLQIQKHTCSDSDTHDDMMMHVVQQSAFYAPLVSAGQAYTRACEWLIDACLVHPVKSAASREVLGL